MTPLEQAIMLTVVGLAFAPLGGEFVGGAGVVADASGAAADIGGDTDLEMSLASQVSSDDASAYNIGAKAGNAAKDSGGKALVRGVKSWPAQIPGNLISYDVCNGGLNGPNTKTLCIVAVSAGAVTGVGVLTASAAPAWALAVAGGGTGLFTAYVLRYTARVGHAIDRWINSNDDW
jgi:hypothetical protein